MFTKIKGFIRKLICFNMAFSCVMLFRDTTGVYTHRSTGNEYLLLFISNEDSTNYKFIPSAVYMSEDYKIYSRPLSEFKEKFVSNDEKDKVYYAR